MYRTAYRTVDVNGLSVFYREAGPQDAPTILLLHGFPSSSRMWQPLLDRLADRFHLVAPDYPGFGHSDAPRHTAGTCQTPRCTSSTPATSLSTSSPT
jgi:pimeloyl-ACP methyl ester carboxylesterase